MISLERRALFLAAALVSGSCCLQIRVRVWWLG